MNKLLLLFFLFALLTGCYYDDEETLYPTPVVNVNDTTPVAYSQDISVIIGTNCAKSGCHLNFQVPDLSTYANLKANIERVKVRAINERSMPAAGPLSNADLVKLQKWIDAGSPNN